MIMKKESKPIYQRKFYGPSGEVYLSKRIFYILNSLEKFPLKNYPFSGTTKCYMRVLVTRYLIEKYKSYCKGFKYKSLQQSFEL